MANAYIFSIVVFKWVIVLCTFFYLFQLCKWPSVL